MTYVLGLAEGKSKCMIPPGRAGAGAFLSSRGRLEMCTRRPRGSETPFEGIDPRSSSRRRCDSRMMHSAAPAAVSHPPSSVSTCRCLGPSDSPHITWCLPSKSTQTYSDSFMNSPSAKKPSGSIWSSSSPPRLSPNVRLASAIPRHCTVRSTKQFGCVLSDFSTCRSFHAVCFRSSCRR